MAETSFANAFKKWYQLQHINPYILPPELSTKLYEIYINYAFAGISGNKPNEYGIKPGTVYLANS